MKDIQIPRDFLNCLREEITQFKTLSNTDQMGLAIMAWEAACGHRVHKADDASMSFSASEMDEVFGSKRYSKIEEKILMFNRSPNWDYQKSETRRYTATPMLEKAIDTYFRSKRARDVEIIGISGGQIKERKSIPKAISSTGTSGGRSSKKYWNLNEFSSLVAVDLASLGQLKEWLEIQVIQNDGSALGIKQKNYLRKCNSLLVEAHTKRAGEGNVLHVYAISPSGRLYAKGVNLQNSPGPIRKTALNGLYEYDFSNCHFTLTVQMAEEHGIECSEMKQYLQDKRAFRNDVCNSTGMTDKQVKTCLLALLYGARLSLSRESSIVKLVGEDAARKLYSLQRITSLVSEIKGVRKVVTRDWTRTANGSLTNALGVAIEGKAKAPRKMAHLVQGIEALALKTIVLLHQKDIVLLQHDGFVSRVPLDISMMEEAVLKATGYQLKLEVDRLQLNFNEIEWGIEDSVNDNDIDWDALLSTEQEHMEDELELAW